jgi:omega-6 fatty acid desaturase (delta-12 desaturase)
MRSIPRAARPDTLTSDWRPLVAAYQTADWRRSVWQLANSLIPYAALFALMTLSLDISYWLTLLLAVPAAGFLLRIFIIFHDCGHSSFFQSRTANRVAGVVCGVLTFTPYDRWRLAHARHHATAGNLDKRGMGDVWTMTVAEYRAAPTRSRLAYRVFRNPLVMFGVGPLFAFVVSQRFTRRAAAPRERRSVMWTNLALLGLLAVMASTIGLRAYALVQLPIIVLAGTAGIWLFYVQHQFEGVYWRRKAEWDYTQAALQGSSFYQLPGLLRWFTGNIGYHHIHHLSPRIPNYYLRACHEQSPLFQSVAPLSLRASLKSLRLRLWDEEQGTLVGFGEQP